MPRYAITIHATVEATAQHFFEVEADDETAARAEAVALAEEAVYGWELLNDTLEVKSGTCTTDECELVEGTDDE